MRKGTGHPSPPFVRLKIVPLLQGASDVQFAYLEIPFACLDTGNFETAKTMRWVLLGLTLV